MRVEDNGCGFDLDVALASTGFGVRSMIERLERRGGSFRVESVARRGATLLITLPLARKRLAHR
jgi:signal transduction histidine kinase